MKNKPDLDSDEVAAKSNDESGEKVKKSKKDKGEKSEKKEKKAKERAVVTMKHSKALKFLAKEPKIVAATGSFWRPGTSSQMALEMIIKGAADGKTVKEVKDQLQAYRKDKGCDRSLDKGYFPYCVTCHADHFQVWNDGKYELIKPFTPDLEAAKREEAEEEERKARAKAAKEAKKSKSEDGDEKPSKKDKKDKKSKKSKPDLDSDDDETDEK